MNGKIAGGSIVAAAVIAGAALYYLQIYHFYEEVAETEVLITPRGADTAEPLEVTAVEAIDATSSPIRYRACFETPVGLDTLSETYTPYEGAEPLVAPGWFDCFDADAIAARLDVGTARAFLGVGNIEYGIDRIVVVTEDGRGYVWHQINRCGEVVFDGDPVPEDCPPPPQS